MAIPRVPVIAARARLAASRKRPCVGGLMTHRVQDARAEQPVIAGLGKRERLNEIPLGKRTAGRAVVAHPGREKRCLSGRGEQRAADALADTGHAAGGRRRC